MPPEPSHLPPDDELAAWLRLSLTRGVGPSQARRLLGAFGPPQALFGQSAAAWREVVGPAAAAALAQPPPALAEQLALTQGWLAQATPGGPPRGVVTLADPHYPAPLLTLPDPPLLLWWCGQPGLAEAAPLAAPWRSVAIVGTRNPTPQGKHNARLLAQALAQAGVCVVSGLALGIDGAAHEGALQGWDSAHPDGPPWATLAVVGTGLDRVYPCQHRPLAQAITRCGLLLSEFAPGTPPLPTNFPRRNRLIAGLSSGTLVVEAAMQSGSLITARLACEQGREVFAVPGSIHAPQSRGCHALLRQGATLVEGVADLLDVLQAQWPAPTPPAPSSPPPAAAATAEDPLLAALGHDIVGLDALADRTGWSVAALQAQLLALELSGALARLPGGRFQRLVRG